jgi:ribosomal protein S12 methylthiotransferase accessory factor YcaO
MRGRRLPWTACQLDPVVAAAMAIRSAMVAEFHAVQLRERDQVRQPRHGAVVVHDLADHARGLSPALRAMSTAASVWPARTSTPPSRAISGKTWPGVTMSSRALSG